MNPEETKQFCENEKLKKASKKLALSDDDPVLKAFEKWYAKGYNSALKKVLSLLEGAGK